MSYAWLGGSITVRPPLPESKLKELGLYVNDNDVTDAQLTCESAGEEETIGLVDGEIKVIAGDSWTTVTVRDNDTPYGVNDLESDLNVLLGLVDAHSANASGAIYFMDDMGPGRYYVEGNEFQVERPVALWPNGDKTTEW